MNAATQSKRAEDIRITFKVKKEEMAEFPMAAVRAAVYEKIANKGKEFFGDWEVVVGDVVPNLAKGFHWKRWSEGQQGVGFCFGPVIENGISFQGRCYSLKPDTESGIDIAAFVALIDRPTAQVVQFAGSTPKNESDLRPNCLDVLLLQTALMQKFFAECVELSKKRHGPIFPKDARSAFKSAFGDSYDNRSIGQYLRSMTTVGMLRKISTDRGEAYTFSPGAAQWLPKEHIGLAGTVIKPPKLSADVLQSKPEKESVMHESSYQEVALKDRLAKLLVTLKERDTSIALLQEQLIEALAAAEVACEQRDAAYEQMAQLQQELAKKADPSAALAERLAKIKAGLSSK